MKGFEFDPGASRISFINGTRTVASTDGTLVCFLPEADNFIDTISVVFPDVPTSIFYNHWWVSQYTTGDVYIMDEGCVTGVVATPWEWEDTTVLAAAPDGADIFASKVRINRTGNPSTWGGATIDVLPKQNVWIPFTGSVLCEAELCMSRAFSLYIDGGDLVLHRQQSVGPPMGGYGAYGSSSPVGAGGGPGVTSTGGTNSALSEQGFLVYTIESKSIASYPEDPFGLGNPPNKPVANAYGGAQQCSISDPTNYQSTYTVDIIGKFGRRS